MSWNADYLRNVFVYDPVTGWLFWRYDRTKVKAGDRAGWTHKTVKYRYVYLDGKTVKEHKIIWCMQTGSWPTVDVDHHNGVKDQNWWLNLREATRGQNNANAQLRSDSQTGSKGVSWFADRQKYRSRVTAGGKSYYLGYFSRKEDAVAAYQKKAEELFGEYAFHLRRGPK
jgi:HNH endonuclease